MDVIPKIIHYVWVGNTSKPDFVMHCIDSWKRFLPDYEIIEWNNDSLTNINNAYVNEAFANKKWAFVSDYLRLYALYNYGGIYLDSDCEITKNIDCFLNLDFFSCYEIYGENNKQFPISALMGAKKNNKIIKDLLAEYDHIHFVTKNGLDLTTNTARISQYFKKEFNLNEPYDGLQTSYLNDKSVIFPYFYFCHPVMGKENFAIHHFNGSWKPAYQRKDKLKIGNYIFSQFKKIKDGELPISNAEEVIFSIKLSNVKTLAFIKINV